MRVGEDLTHSFSRLRFGLVLKQFALARDRQAEMLLQFKPSLICWA